MTCRSYAVVIVGGGAAGLSAALVLARAPRRVVVLDAGSPRNAPAAHMHNFLSPDVVFFRHTLGVFSTADRQRLAARDVRVIEGQVGGLVVEGDRLTGVQLADSSVVARTAVFVVPRFIANDAVLAALGAATERTALGTRVSTDPTGRTSVPGVWAVGNVADVAAFVIEAAAAGARAAATLNADLVEEDVARAVADRGRVAAAAAP